MADITKLKPNTCPYCGATWGMTTGCANACDGSRKHRALLAEYRRQPEDLRTEAEHYSGPESVPGGE